MGENIKDIVSSLDKRKDFSGLLISVLQVAFEEISSFDGELFLGWESEWAFEEFRNFQVFKHLRVFILTSFIKKSHFVTKVMFIRSISTRVRLLRHFRLFWKIINGYQQLESLMSETFGD